MKSLMNSHTCQLFAHFNADLAKEQSKQKKEAWDAESS
jgi:hypothetical protein